MIPMYREDAAWLAGLVDGEGCFDNPRGNPRIRIKMSDFDVVIRAATLMGARTYTETDPTHGLDRKPLLVAQITGAPAVSVMTAILPWLGSRRTAKATDIITTHNARQRRAVRLLPRAAA